jgi:4-amino-4-deoxy-L-arabinose transferase-like glycosyltransferase
MFVEQTSTTSSIAGTGPKSGLRRYVVCSIALILLHVFFMLFRYGSIPISPVAPDEVVINDASVSLAQGHGFIAESFTDSKYGLDHMFAHFPPLYPYTEALAFKLFGISVYSLRLTTTVMSIGSTIVLFLLLWRLCRQGLMHPDVALLVNGLYCVNASAISAERWARMESMIGLLMLLSLAAILYAIAPPPGKPVWPAMLAGGFFGALTIAVHPEAITGVILLAALMLFLVPVKAWVRLAAASLFVLAPLAVGLMIYGRNILIAAHQFLRIAHDSASTNRTSYQVLWDWVHDRDISAMNRNLFLASIMFLLLVAPLTFLWNRTRLQRTSLRYRLSACFAAAGVIEILLMVFALRMDSRRCQFLLGTLLVLNALCLWGNGRLKRWQGAVGWLFIAAQCAVTGYYLSARNDRVADMNSRRFLPLIERLPAGVSVAATAGLWLDMKEAKRPFTLIVYGLDGENEWMKLNKNPLEQFDIVIIEDEASAGKTWLKDEAHEGRTDYTYPVGSKTVEVYVRKDIPYQP